MSHFGRWRCAAAVLSGLAVMLSLTCCGKGPETASSAGSSTPVTAENSTDPLDEADILARADNTKSVDELITQTYDAAYIAEHFGTYFSVRAHSGYFETLASVDAVCKIECLRDMGGGNYYAVFKVTEGGRWYSFFPKEDNNLLSHNVYVQTPLDREAFDRLEPGDTLTDVLRLDSALKMSMDEQIVVNMPAIKHDIYTIHFFGDQIYLIRYVTEEEPPVEDYGRVFIESIEKYPTGVITLDFTPSHMINGDYDYSILPQDYPAA